MIKARNDIHKDQETFILFIYFFIYMIRQWGQGLTHRALLQ